MSKSKYLSQFQTDYFQLYDQQVIAFIAEILFSTHNENDNIRKFFRAGYCYYFAVMLQNAFQRGKLCLTEPFGHIVWVDEDDLAYDIEGPYVPGYHECERLTDIEFLGDAVYDFLHIPGKEYHAPKLLHEWAEFMHMSDIYAVTKIYIDMSKENVDYSKTITDNVYSYWMENKEELQEKYWKLRED